MKAIEAGARALARTFCNHWFDSGLATHRKMTRDFVNGSDAWKAEAQACIEAAIASGELVPANANNSALADELDGWHDCADGDVSAGNGHFRLQCVSDSDQQRLNLRATLREAAKALRSMVPASQLAAERERCALKCDELGAREQENFGLTRAAQNYFRARNAIRALESPSGRAGT